jgi:hypothetical protein
MAPSKIGLPYGTIPRIISAWMTTEAVQTKSPVLELGDSLSAFMRQLDMEMTGGKNGTITALKNQARRFFASTFTAIYEDHEKTADMGFRVAEDSLIWWNHSDPEQAGLWNSTVTLSNKFFNEIQKNPVPIDMRAIKALKKSPLALDIYCWTTYRVSYLARDLLIPWDKVALQFGSGYARMRDFKAAFLEELDKVHNLYPALRYKVTEDGLMLKPSPTHVPKKLSPK